MDRRMELLIKALSWVGVLIMAFILVFLLWEGLPVLKTVSLGELLTGKLWYPAEEPPVLGMAALIVGSLAVTLISTLVGLPFGLGMAIFLAEIAPRRMKEILKPALELLGFLPSIVVGFLGMVLVAPWMQQTFGLVSGLNMLNASILLGLLMVPVVGSLAQDALEAVPQDLRDASMALGASRWETICRVVLRAASSGLMSSALLGIMRSFGETMVVLMASGGAAVFPRSLTSPVRPLTSAIAAEMGETPVGSPHYRALFFAGLILVAGTLILNGLAMAVERRSALGDRS